MTQSLLQELKSQWERIISLLCEMATTMVLPSQRRHQHHQSFHLQVIGEKETDTQTEVDGSYPGSELMSETTHTEVCGIVIIINIITGVLSLLKINY